MANMLQSAVAHAVAALKGNRGDVVTYQRGGDSVSITAAMGSTDLEREADGAQISFRSIDFIVSTADIVLAGQETRPRRGDRIVSESESTTRTYEVLAIDNEQPYAFSDPDGTVLRIHTKLIREE